MQSGYPRRAAISISRSMGVAFAGGAWSVDQVTSRTINELKKRDRRPRGARATAYSRNQSKI